MRDNIAEIRELNQQLAKYYDLPQSTNVYVSTGIGSRFAMREKVYHITPENAENEMNNAVVIIAPKFGMYPYSESETDAIFAKLMANKSVRQIKIGENLYIFATKDLDDKLFTQQ